MKINIDPKKPKRGRTNWEQVDSFSDAEIRDRARSDPDAQPLTQRELQAMRRVPDVKRLRLRLGLSQEDFARSFQLSLATVRDWEQGRSEPDQSSRTLLQLIEQIPDKIITVLRKCREDSVLA